MCHSRISEFAGSSHEGHYPGRFGSVPVLRVAYGSLIRSSYQLSQSRLQTTVYLVNEKPQPEDQPGLSLPRQHPRERTRRNTHGRLIQSECSAGVNAQNGLPLRRARQCAKASMPITIRMVPKCSSVNPARSSPTIGARQATKKSTIEIRSSRFPPKSGL